MKSLRSEVRKFQAVPGAGQLYVRIWNRVARVVNVYRVHSGLRVSGVPRV
jgi:hypothetical protein